MLPVLYRQRQEPYTKKLTDAAQENKWLWYHVPGLIDYR